MIGGDGVLISYNAGVNFYLGNNPESERTIGLRPGWDWSDLVNLPLKEGIVRPSQKSRFFLARSWEYIQGQPFAYLGLLCRKTLMFWHGNEVGRDQDIYFWRNYSPVLAATLWKKWIAFPFGIVGPLALLGMLVAIRRQGITLPVVFVAAYALGIIAFFVVARYRTPTIPVLLIFAACGGHYLYTCVQERRWQAAGLGSAAYLAFALLANHNLSPMEMGGDAEIHYNLGNAYAQRGQQAQALAAFERAVQLDPEYWQAWSNLGSLCAVRGDLVRAIQIFERVVKARPEQAEAWLNLAHARRATGDQRATLQAYQETLKANPRHLQACTELIGFYLQAGDFHNAEAILQQAVKYYPEQEEALRYMYESIKARILTGGRAR